jgi:sigma-E processing peptidase SpoIIGA
MKIQVYGDIAFLINFCMDYILLSFMCRAASCRASCLRRAAAAAIGGIGAVCAFYVNTRFGIPMQLFLGVLMCMAAAPWSGVRALVCRTAVFFGGALVLGGGMLALLCGIGANVLVKSGAFYIEMNVGILMLSALICTAFLYTAEFIIRHSPLRLRKSVIVRFMGKSAVLRGYVDTGNTLTAGGMPVILAHWESVRELFPSGASLADFMTYCPPGRTRAVEYRVVDGNGVIWCIEPDGVLVDGRHCDALVGICGHSLSAEYDVLLGAAM